MQENTTIFIRDDERPPVKQMFKSMKVGDTLSVAYEPKLHANIKQECHRQNEVARALGGELNLFFRTKKVGNNIIIYKLK